MKTANCASVSKPTVAVRGASVPESDDHAGQPRSATAAVPRGKSRRCRWQKRVRNRRAAQRPGSRHRRIRNRRVAATGSTGRTAASPRASGTPEPSRRAMFFNSRTAIQSPSMITPVQTPITPAMISVLPILNSLTGIPYADRQQARQNKADPGDQHNKHHRTNPSAAPETLASRPTPRYRHIVRTANRAIAVRVPQ